MADFDSGWEEDEVSIPPRLQKKWDDESQEDPSFIVCCSCGKKVPQSGLLCLYCGNSTGQSPGVFGKLKKFAIESFTGVTFTILILIALVLLLLFR